MLENENLVSNDTENVEQTTEETQPTVKTYTQDEVNEIVGKAKARTRAKIQKETQIKYGDLIDTLKAGTGEEDVGKLTDTFRDFYQKKGITIPQKSAEHSAKDIEVLARADAEEIISGGIDEVIEEADRLNDLGAENMTAREKAVFKALTNHIKETETSQELAKIGVTEDVYKSQEFKDFASKFNSNTTIKDIYDIYKQTQPKKEFKTMGSMTNNNADSKAVKDYYSFEEASKFTKEDFDKNPELFKAVENSMSKWK